MNHQKNKEDATMITDFLELQRLDDMKFARIHPKAYDQMVRSRKEFDLSTYLRDLIKILFARK